MVELFNNLPWYKKIEVLRTIKGLSQEEAAKKCFTNQKSFWSWESGQVYPRKNNRLAIARLFELEESEIFGQAD